MLSSYSMSPIRTRYGSRVVLGVCVALSCCSTGCSYSIGAAVLPTMDTDREVGLEARLQFGAGLTNAWPKRMEGRRTAAVMPSVYAGARKSLSEASSLCASAGTGLQYANVGEVPGRIGFRTAINGLVNLCHYDDRPAGISLQAAPLYTLEQGRSGGTTPYLTVGPLFEAAMLARDTLTQGRFGAGITLDWIHLTRWDIAM